MSTAELLIAGGGLQAGLIALAARARRPGARVTLVERAPRLGGNHTWSFHESDLGAEMAAVVAPLVVARWPGYEVAFPGLRRQLPLAYASISSARFDEVLRASGCDLVLGAEVVDVGVDRLLLADGRQLRGDQIVDARGPEARPGDLQGYQKFLGLEVLVRGGPIPALPTLIDATVPQRDGLRFLYTLPFAPDRLLIEDTFYSDTPDLDAPALRAGLLVELVRRGLEPVAVLREEQGVLPLPLAGRPPAHVAGAPLVAGYRGGWIHPTTGYSLPVAARLAWAVAGPDPDAEVAALAARLRDQMRFCRLLNRLLFRATPPDLRWRVLERFHRLSEETIGRFYRLELSGADRARILCGRPPRGLSLRAAFAAIGEPS